MEDASTRYPLIRNTKKACSLEEVAIIYYYKAENSREQRASNFWLFSYFASGFIARGIAFLKYHDIEGEYLVFKPKDGVGNTQWPNTHNGIRHRRNAGNY